MHNLQQEEQH